MVFGNKGDTSATGVAFTRDPSTGEPGIFGEFLVNAQGEDVVAGHPHADAARADGGRPAGGASTQFVDTARRLEEHYRDMQDVEFTVEEGTLYLLQTRTAKRTAAAALKAARRHGRRGADLAARRRSPASTRRSSTSCSTRCSTRSAPLEVAAKGLNASPGAAVGAIVFDADTAEARGRAARA